MEKREQRLAPKKRRLGTISARFPRQRLRSICLRFGNVASSQTPGNNSAETRTGWLGRQDSNLGMAESKSDHFFLVVNRHSEKTEKFSHNSINTLGRVSEKALRPHWHAITRKWPPVRIFFQQTGSLKIRISQPHPSSVPRRSRPAAWYPRHAGRRPHE